jgi:hypothetical protein
MDGGCRYCNRNCRHNGFYCLTHDISPDDLASGDQYRRQFEVLFGLTVQLL